VRGNLTPQYTATTTLSPEQQAILNQTNGAQLNLSTLANNQSGFLKDYLGQSIDLSGAPALQSSLGNGYQTDVGSGYQTNIGNGYQMGLGDGYQTSLGANYRNDLGPGFQQSLGNGYQTGVGDGYQSTYSTDFSADRQKVEDSLMARQQPALEQNRDQLRTQLIASGIRPGTAAYNSEMARLSSSENDARLATIAAGGQEQSRLVGLEADRANFTNSSLLNKAAFGNQATLGAANFGNNAALQSAQFGNQSALDAANFGNTSTLNKAAFGNAAALESANFGNNALLNRAQFGNQAALNQANFGNAARGQYLNEAYAQRNQPISEISALLSGSQVQNPNFVQTPQTQVGGVDYTGLVQNQYAAQQKNAAATNGGLFGLLSGGIGLLSDRRAKKDIKHIGQIANGLKWYEYRYLTDADDAPIRQGLMSDDVRKQVPEAVIFDAVLGYDKVNYELAMR